MARSPGSAAPCGNLPDAMSASIDGTRERRPRARAPPAAPAVTLVRRTEDPQIVVEEIFWQ
ncbi:hypothetical protein [Streptomyces beigongshangae]|uniref:hypothetical protein n=1 Tax=Streptomyces beigongshangae TaxID=2841597 RepID=UPI0021A357B1|nr:hypothetical protein [Streptomyces sp. REN17]